MRCARGETGEAPIRDGPPQRRAGPGRRADVLLRRRGAVRARALPLARAVAGAADLDAAREALAALGVRTELDYERSRAAERLNRRGD